MKLLWFIFEARRFSYILVIGGGGLFLVLRKGLVTRVWFAGLRKKYRKTYRFECKFWRLLVWPLVFKILGVSRKFGCQAKTWVLIFYFGC